MISGTPGGTRSRLKIFASIFISFIGAEVLGLPYAFKEAGVLEGIFLMVLVGICSVKAMLLIIDCKYKILEIREIQKRYPAHTSWEDDGGDGLHQTRDLLRGEADLVIRVKDLPFQTKDLSYGDIGYEALGPCGQLLVDLVVVISQTGFCCAYLIFISVNLSDYINSLKLIHWLLVLLPLLSVLTLFRHLSSLAITSLFAQWSSLMAFGVVYWFDFEHFISVDIHPTKISVVGFPFFMSIAIYCYEGAGMILALESSLAEDIRYKFRRYFIFTMAVVTSLYVSFGSAGYLSFGPETKPIITLNLSRGSSVDFSMIVISCLCLAHFFTYPVMMFPVTHLLEAYFITDPEKNVWKGNILRVSTVLVTGIVVLLIPNFANLLALVGASGCTVLTFILPAVFHWKIYAKSLTWSQRLVDILLIVLGVIGTVVGTADALKRLGQTYSHSEAARGPAIHLDGNGPTATPFANASVSETVRSRKVVLTTASKVRTSTLSSKPPAVSTRMANASVSSRRIPTTVRQ